MRYRRNLKMFTGQMDVASFMGVLFTLIIFLVLHSNLAPPPGMRIQLPAGDMASLPGTANPMLVLSVDRDQRLYFDHQVVRESELKARLAVKVRQAREPVILLLQADESVPYAAIVRLGAIAREAGVREVHSATRPSLFPPPAPNPGK